MKPQHTDGGNEGDPRAEITAALNEEQLKPRSADHWRADVVARVLRQEK